MNEWSALGQWSWLVVALSLGAAIWLMRNEARRSNRRQLPLRLAATLVAVLALTALLLRPSREIDAAFSDAVLLTDGASSSRAKRFIDSAKVVRAFALKSSDDRPLSQDFTSLPDVGFLRRNFPDVAALHVFGNGFAAHDLAELDGIRLQLHLDALPDGFRAAPSLEISSFGKPVSIRGAYHQSDGKSKFVYIADADGALDSLPLVPNGKTQVVFSATPKAVGRFLYSLSTRSATGDTVALEVAPVIVEPADTLSLLAIETAPNFETRQLKSWATATGNRAAIRAAVSRGKSATEFLNMNKRPLDRLTPDALAMFDIVLLDVASLAALSGAERDALKRAVELGLGVFITIDDATDLRRSFSESKFFLDVKATAEQGNAERNVKPTGFGATTSAVSALASPLELKAESGMKILASDERQRPLTLSMPRGLGRVGISILHETYRWALEGKTDVHAAYWSHVLSATARRGLDVDEWRVVTQTPVVDMPIMLDLRTASNSPVGIVRGGAEIDTMFLAQDALEPTLWRGVFWARAAGWHSISNGATATAQFYVFGKGERQSQRALERQTLTMQYANAQTKQTTTVDANKIKHREPLPSWWFFLLFVAATGYLWAERKF